METIFGFALIMLIIGGGMDGRYQDEKLINCKSTPKHEKCKYETKKL